MSGTVKRTEMNVDAELARMREETPEMPADFHARWTEALHREMNAAEAPSPAPETQPRRAGGSQWKRLAGIAAVFVFLIGGTLLSRDQLRAKPVKTAVLTAPAAKNELRQLGGAAGGMDAAMPPVLATGAPTAEPEAYAEEPAYAYGVAGGGRDGMLPPAAQAAEEGGMPDSEEAAEEYATEVYAAEEDRAEAAPFEEEAAEEAATEEEAPEEEQEKEAPEEETSDGEAPEKEEQGGFLREAGLFMEDMGRFLLAALPWLAGAGASAAAVLLLCRRKHK